MRVEQPYIDLYQQHGELLCRHSSPVLNAQRAQAFQAFQQQGFPTRKLERYKYTDISKLFEPDFGMNLRRVEVQTNPYEVFRGSVPQLSTSPYFVVNDAYYPPSAPHRELPAGVLVGSLRQLSEQYPDLVGSHYGKIAEVQTDGITAFNTAFAQDGLLIYVPRGVVMEHPLQLINLLRTDHPLLASRRVLLILEAGAQLTLLACDHALSGAQTLATQVIEAYVGDNASLDLYCLEETHAKNVRVSNVYIDQQANSRVNHNVITLHNGVTRNKLDLTFSGEGAECQCYGCVIADKQQHVDNNTLITHKVTHCTSNELYKYVLDDKSTGAFAGRVLVEPGAQKTSSQMTNQNLTATREARMYTQPMLEIYADDVKCAHGSTVGQLNDAALFYMRQRGISLSEAKMLLQNAFINEVIDKMQLEPLRDRLHHLVEKRFRGELSKCKGCKLCK